MSDRDYKEINRKAWNSRTQVHIDSEFYDNPTFMQGRSSLNDIELPLLGDLNGKSVLHLQCHFGQDSLSMSRMGAKVTGVDLSDAAIFKAREMAAALNLDAQFICCDIYELPENLTGKFDIVFTSYGTIGWLPDLDKWAQIVSKYLKKGGRFIMAEFHPVVWMFDNNFKKIQYRYFNSGPIEETEAGTYAGKKANIVNDYVSWNHSLSEVLTSLLNHSLNIETFNEYDYSPYDCFAGTEKIALNKFRIKHLNDKIPMVYSIVAIKK